MLARGTGPGNRPSGAGEPITAMSSITYIVSFSNAKSRILAFSQCQAIQPTIEYAEGVMSPG